MLSSNFRLPLSTKSGNRVKMKRNYQWPAKIAKVNVNMDCFSLIKGQWKLFKGQWKVREFLTFWWVATPLWVRNIPDGGIDMNWWNESYYFWTAERDHVHFHIYTEYFCWLWKAIYLFNCFFYTQMWWQNFFCVFLLSKTQTAFWVLKFLQAR